MTKQKINRRHFLQKGIGLASVSLIPFELDSALVIRSSDFDPHAEKILLKYGGEFGHVKPEMREENHGHI